MFGSFSIGRLFGIQVRVHWMFVALVVLLAASSPQPWAHTVAEVFVGFGCVLLHELGHSLVAIRYGIRVYDITLWPLGGMARMDHIPESPKIESLVAVAGPAVNFVLAGVAIAAMLAFGLLPLSAPTLRDWFVREDWVGTAAAAFVLYNLLLGAFNLVPAFPMDGGRVLRAILGAFHDWVRATEIAVNVGRVVAFFTFALALFLMFRSGFDGFSISLLLIALFFGWAGTSELWAVRLRHGQFPFGNFGGQFGGVRFQFGGPGAHAGAREPLEEPVRAAPRPEPAPSDAVDPETGARRPVADWRTDGFGRERIDDEAIAKLERFHGRLKRGDEPAE
ncbi:MAG: site-2 protease family protein [Planctomycetes bacterium]|nr:site-2 protease family protein [Planctomycetota bacterium]